MVIIIYSKILENIKLFKKVDSSVFIIEPTV